MSFAPRIRVDFNRRSNGYVVASARRATEELSVGEVVVAYQPGENMEYFARVVDIPGGGPRVVLEVDWSSDPSAWVRAAPGTAVVDAVVRAGFDSFYRSSLVTTTPPQASGTPAPVLASARAA